MSRPKGKSFVTAAQTAVEPSRRRFLHMTGCAVLAGCSDPGEVTAVCGPLTETDAVTPSDFQDIVLASDPFQLGVASGDPLEDSVILWTRLIGDDSDALPEAVDVRWEVALDGAFEQLVAQGVQTARQADGHALHVDVQGLGAAQVYWYRFTAGGFQSAVGRTKTLPCGDAAVSDLKIGFATCQRYSDGYYAAHRDMASKLLDLVVFLGDYIYESGGTGIRAHESDREVFTLEEYRARYAHYRSDPDLQLCHASAPWMPIWDDHEVDNNHAGPHAPGSDVAAWAARRAAAYQAWYEHMPVRIDPPDNDSLGLYRSVQIGDLVQLLLLDGRQYRDIQPCGDVLGTRCDEVDEERTLLGDNQEVWLREELASSSARWRVVANPVVMLPMDFGDVFVNPDQWDGYPLARQRFIDDVMRHAQGEVVVVTGDVHAAGVGYVPELPLDLESPPAVTEFVVPSISSAVYDERALTLGPLLAALPHLHWWDFSRRGWLLLRVTPQDITAYYQMVAVSEDPDSLVSQDRTWQVVQGIVGASEV